MHCTMTIKINISFLKLQFACETYESVDNILLRTKLINVKNSRLVRTTKKPTIRSNLRGTEYTC